MAIKQHNPTSAGRRFYTTSSYEEITKKTPENLFLKRKIKMQEETLKGVSLFVTKVVETDKNTV